MNPIAKISLAVASTLAFQMPMNAQTVETYKVVKIQGEIIRVKTGNNLSIGEDVVSNENLNFKNNYSRAMVVNKEKGCMILSANSDNGGPQFLPAQNNMSVRNTLPSQPSEVLDYFYGFVAVIGCDSLKIDDEKLSISNDSYFSVNYNVNGQTMSDRIVCRNGKLALPASIVKDKPEKVEICYNNEFGLTKKSEFKPIYVNEQMLKEEISLIFDAVHGEKKDKIAASVAFVNDFYGKTSAETVEPWIEKNL